MTNTSVLWLFPPTEPLDRTGFCRDCETRHNRLRRGRCTKCYDAYLDSLPEGCDDEPDLPAPATALPLNWSDRVAELVQRESSGQRLFGPFDQRVKVDVQNRPPSKARPRERRDDDPCDLDSWRPSWMRTTAV